VKRESGEVNAWKRAGLNDLKLQQLSSVEREDSMLLILSICKYMRESTLSLHHIGVKVASGPP
jgi:hypothetical protein